MPRPVGSLLRKPEEAFTSSAIRARSSTWILIEGNLIDLEALPAPNRGLANQPNS
jgi:hypothetical protein